MIVLGNVIFLSDWYGNVIVSDVCLVEYNFIFYFVTLGGGERADARHTVNPERDIRLPSILAGLCHHGSWVVCREILRMSGRRRGAASCAC